MKKNFFYRAVIIIQIMLVASFSYSQKQSADPNFNSKMKIAKPDSTVSPATSSNYSKDLSSLNSKIAKNFTRNFKNADDLRISTFENNTYIYCVTNGVVNRIRYNRKGNWDYTIRYYQEDQLPIDIRKQVKSNFFDYDISGVTEVTVRDKTAYLVRIKSISNWKTVKILEDEMTVVGSYQEK